MANEKREALVKAGGKRIARGRPALKAPPLAPLKRREGEPIERHVYEALRQSFMSGSILPGARISSRSIAQAFGVSAMPVRAALKRLEAEGIIQSAARSAFVVCSPTVDEYKEILQIRLNLEGMLAFEAAKYITQVEVDKARILKDRMKQSDSYSEMLGMNYELHFLVYRAARMPFTVSLIETIWIRIGPLLHSIYADMDVVKTIIDYHDWLVDGLARGDGKATENAIRSDLTDSGAVILRQLRQSQGESKASTS